MRESATDNDTLAILGGSMKQLGIKSIIAISLATFSLHAAAADAPNGATQRTPQQNRMAACNQDAAGKKGDERKAFMKTCLADKRASQQVTQQDKMKACNKQAAGQKGDERKRLMSACLKG